MDPRMMAAALMQSNPGNNKNAMRQMMAQAMQQGTPQTPMPAPMTPAPAPANQSMPKLPIITTEDAFNALSPGQEFIDGRDGVRKFKISPTDAAPVRKDNGNEQ